MRLKAGSRSSEHDEALQTNTADFVLQVGNMKVPLKAEKLLGGSVRVSSKTEMPLKAEKLLGPPALNEEDRAIEAFERMQEACSVPAQGQRGGSWAPWSPDDMYPFDSQPNLSPHIGTSRNAPDARRPEPPRREPSDANLPGYYDSAPQDYAVASNTAPAPTSAPAPMPAPAPNNRDSVAPTIFDNLSGPRTPSRDIAPANMKNFEASRRSKTTSRSASIRPRKLDLVQLFPQSKAATGRMLSSARLSSSPSSLHGRSDLPPLPDEAAEPNGGHSSTSGRAMTYSSGSSGGKQKANDDLSLDQYKTNRRRPPKGIQNWFDAYPESEEDEEEDDEDDEDGQDVSQPAATRPVPRELAAPQELPADELPPAYSAPSREISRASEKSGTYARSSETVSDNRQARENNTVQEEMERYRHANDSHSWDSIQSSHIGRIAPDASNERFAASLGAGQSVMSFSQPEYTDPADADEGARRPTLRGNIPGDRVVTLASASSIELHDMPKVHLEQARNQLGSRERQSSGYPPEQTSLRQLTRADPNFPSNRSDPTLHESVAGASHIMAVTEEEKMILDLLRQKRTVAQNTSFTEGYHMALQAEQQRIAHQGTPAERNALKTLQRAQNARRDSEMSSTPSPADTADMRRQLSAIRKQQVDGQFQIERFLGAADPRQLSSYPYDGPVELPNNRLSGELLPATVYSPAGTPSVRSPAFNQDTFQSPDDTVDTDDIKRRVEQFIATNGAVPPLNTQIKLMQRQPKGRRSSMPPAPVIEEEPTRPHRQPPPTIPRRSPDRGHTRGPSDLASKISSVSLTDEPRSDSPVSAFPTTTESDIPFQFQHPQQQDEDQQQQQQQQQPPPPPTSLGHQDTTSQPKQRPASVSPFSCLIKAASTSKLPLSAESASAVPSTGSSLTVTPENAEEKHTQPPSPSSSREDQSPPVPPRKLPSPVSRYSSSNNEKHNVPADGAGSSTIGISSAGEDVLAAWHNLGGATEGLSIQQSLRPGASGPLSGIMNA